MSCKVVSCNPYKSPVNISRNTNPGVQLKYKGGYLQVVTKNQRKLNNSKGLHDIQPYNPTTSINL